MKKICNLFILFFLFAFSKVFCQESKPFLDEIRGTVSLTHNGIALVPSFSLGEPALLVDLKFRKDRFSVEPDLRFALEGKPWSMLFWFRYQAIEKKRFTLRTGIHPALNFRTIEILRNGASENILEARRYLAGELVPNYQVKDNWSVGMFYLHGRGFDEGTKQINFLVLNTAVSNISISNDLYLNVTPQAYYLTQDDSKGFYTAGFLTLGKRNFPLSITAIINKAIDTEIAPEDDLIWTILLNYSFPSYKKKKTKQLKI